jgi:hypothetical protein
MQEGYQAGKNEAWLSPGQLIKCAYMGLGSTRRPVVGPDYTLRQDPHLLVHDDRWKLVIWWDGGLSVSLDWEMLLT